MDVHSGNVGVVVVVVVPVPAVVVVAVAVAVAVAVVATVSVSCNTASSENSWYTHRLLSATFQPYTVPVLVPPYNILPSEDHVNFEILTTLFGTNSHVFPVVGSTSPATNHRTGTFRARKSYTPTTSRRHALRCAVG